MPEVTISSKNQIVIPREAREALGIKAGAKLQVVVRGDTVILPRKPRSYSKAIRGLAKGHYPDGYLNKERKSWDQVNYAPSCAGTAASHSILLYLFTPWNRIRGISRSRSGRCDGSRNRGTAE